MVLCQSLMSLQKFWDFVLMLLNQHYCSWSWKHITTKKSIDSTLIDTVSSVFDGKLHILVRFYAHKVFVDLFVRIILIDTLLC